jgi:diamine N-acetyltransferase
MLTNGHITLRVPEPGDVDVLLAMENDTANWRVSDTLVPFSRDLMQRFVESGHDLPAHRQVRYMICRGNEVCGTLDLFDVDLMHQRAGIGILVTAPHRGNGVALQALDLAAVYCRDVLLFHTLHASVMSDNPAAIGLFERAGYQHCGTRSQWYRKPGGWADEHLFTLNLSLYGKK